MSSRYSFLEGLNCSGCGKKYAANQVHTFCTECQSTLLVEYDLDAARRQTDRDEVSRRHKGMWRWHEVLPVLDERNQVTLGEGDTALLPMSSLGSALGLRRLYVKEESSNPTGSFKARGLSAAISKAKELGIKKVIIPTAGNAGGAMASYAARAGMQALIYMPKDTPRANIEESRIVGAEVVLIDGLISDAAGMAGIKAREEGWFDVSTFKEPYRAEGKKIMGYELAEQFDWELPDVIVYPTGGGTGLVGMWKAFQEMEALGWLKNRKRPRMVSVQAAGCAPIPRAFQKKAAFCDFWTNAATIASGLRVPKSFADHLILKCLYESSGTAIAVDDEAIMKAQKELAVAEGIFAAPEGAAAYAALKDLAAQKWIQADERVVLFNTGSGLKYLDRT
ncbi:MAG: threonine synthase [Chloroflexi bacterium]|nr:threonine synthase [Chloroflexota bacterium]MDL1943091.1 threonine synthase [Chloroflexi bacterium CFX2]